MNDTTAVKLRILGKEIQVGCKPGEKEALLSAAGMVETEMKNLQSRGINATTDKIAIITALNMANELQALRERNGQLDTASAILSDLQDRLGKALD